MYRLRSPWFVSLASVVLAFGMLLSLVRPATVVADEEQEVAHVEWLRTQLRTPDDPLVEAALEHAARVPATSIDAFVRAFAEAYLALAPFDAVLADVFDVEAADEVVLDVLQRRYQRLTGESLTHLLLMAVTPSSVSTVQHRLDLGPPLGLLIAERHLARLQGCAAAAGPQVLAFAFRLYSSARSLGP